MNKISTIETIKNQLSQFQEIDKVILFGSFNYKEDPNDLDIAIVQDSKENFISLSLKYRKALRELSKEIPLDIIPIKKDATGVFMDEINLGNVVYER